MLFNKKKLDPTPLPKLEKTMPNGLTNITRHDFRNLASRFYFKFTNSPFCTDLNCIIEIIGTHGCYKESNYLMIQAFNSKRLSSSGIKEK